MKVISRFALVAVAGLLLSGISPPQSLATAPGANGRIIFESVDPETGYYQIHVSEADGTGFKRLTGFTEGWGAFWPTWSPEGKVTFTAVRNGNWDLYSIDPDGTHLRKLVRSKAREGWPAWSPDGNRLAFVRRVRKVWQVFIRNMSTGRERQVTRKERVYHLEWSPTGHRLAFVMPSRGGIGEIYTIRPDGTGLKQVTRGGYVDRLSWSPDGKRIAFSSWRKIDSDQEYELCVPGGITLGSCDIDVYVINADGSSEVQLTGVDDSLGYWDNDPTWSPNGTMILFVSDRGQEPGGIDLHLMDADGSNVRRVLTTPGYDDNSSWEAVR